MNVKHTLQIAVERLDEAVAAVSSSGRDGRDGKILRLAPGLRVQYCLNTDDRSWKLPGGGRSDSEETSSRIRQTLQSVPLDVLWMAPLITGVILLWVRLGLAASGLWPLF